MGRVLSLMLVFASLSCAGSQSRNEAPMEVYAPIPQSILTPDRVDTRIGSLDFFDGIPSQATAAKVYDQLDFQRAVRAYLDALPGASMQAIREGLDEAGALPNYTILLTESRLDSRATTLTANSESVYAFAWLSLKGGPIAVQTPPQVSGFFADAWHRHLEHAGPAGADRGKGALWVIVPPGYTGYVPQTKYAIRSRTYGVLAVFRAPLVKGNAKWAVRRFKERLKVFPLKEAKRPPPNMFVDVSGTALYTVAPNDVSFFESIDDLVQEEPAESQDPELLGVLASIGIRKGKRFEPDARMKEILEEAALVGSATARALVFWPRRDTSLGPGSQWQTFFDAMPALDARAAFHYYANEPPAAPDSGVRGYERAVTFRAADGRFLDGASTYALTLPPNVPAASWSVVAYDNQTRSMLQTDQRFPSSSNERRVPVARDGSITLYFGPKAPKSRKRKASWIQTIPSKGYSVVLRLDRPRDAWFDGSWRPDDLRRIREIPRAPRRKEPPRMATEPRPGSLVPDRISSRLGTLGLADGIPTEATTALLYENLDFIRAVEAYLTAIPGAAQVAFRRGLRAARVEGHGTVGIFDRTVDAHALMLTPHIGTVEVATWIDLRERATIVESPSDTSGVARDFFGRRVTGLGAKGPDDGKGGLYLFVQETYVGQLSERYFAYRSPTYGNLLSWRAFPRSGDFIAPVARIRDTLRIQPFDADFDDYLAEVAEEAATTRFVSLSGKPLNTVHANDSTFYQQVAELVGEEPPEAFGPEVIELFQAIGIEKNTAFEPAPERRALLAEAAAVGTATARAIAFRSRRPEARIYEDSSWQTAQIGQRSDFMDGAARDLDARTRFAYLVAGASEATDQTRPGEGWVSLFTTTDANGDDLDGAKRYRLLLPKDVPVGEGWSVAVYDPQTRSLLQTPESPIPALSSWGGVVPREDGRTEIIASPSRPEDPNVNWIPTVPGKAFFLILRLYRPLEPWFARTWRPGELERID